MVTQRNMNNSLITLFSAILGSVAGLLALVGNILVVSETLKRKVQNKIDAKKRVKKIMKKRKSLSFVDKPEFYTTKRHTSDSSKEALNFI